MSSDWIEIVPDREAVLTQTQRHAHILEQLSLLTSSPKPVKSDKPARQALGYIFVKVSARSPHPQLLADCDVIDQYAELEGRQPSTIVTPLLVTCLFQFAGYVCIFTDDYGGIDGVRVLFRELLWFTDRYPQRPALILVSQSLTATVPEPSNVFTSNSIPELQQLYNMFSEATCVRIPNSRFSSLAGRYSVLRRTLQTAVKRHHSTLSANSVLFSATHQQKLLYEAIKQYDNSHSTSFDHLKSARDHL